MTCDVCGRFREILHCHVSRKDCFILYRGVLFSLEEEPVQGELRTAQTGVSWVCIDAAHDKPEEESLPPQNASGDDVLDDPPSREMPSLEADLQLLNSADPELRLKLILLHRQAEEGRAERRRQAERDRLQAEREQAAQRHQAERESAERQHQLELAKLQQQNRSAGPAEREGGVLFSLEEEPGEGELRTAPDWV
ncbi:MAP7 domain-containing protein 1-like [Hyperolius riggenbachi]|uniref:MAP7 domain-containing protein 1-like n=1 Tax=Hyperolius riggenbachi TaxID=752182 RepID=UPI0035A3D0B6